jgi:hypothetical protein
MVYRAARSVSTAANDQTRLQGRMGRIGSVGLIKVCFENNDEMLSPLAEALLKEDRPVSSQEARLGAC